MRARLVGEARTRDKIAHKIHGVREKGGEALCLASLVRNSVDEAFYEIDRAFQEIDRAFWVKQQFFCKSRFG